MHRCRSRSIAWRALRPPAREIALAVALLAGGGRAAAQRTAPPATPFVFIEGFRTDDTLTRRAAILLRAAVAQRIAPARMRIMTTAEIDAARSSGLPDDFGQPWGWDDVREAAHAYRATSAVDVIAERAETGVVIRTTRVSPSKNGQRVALPEVRARTLERAVRTLAMRLTRDSALLAPPADSGRRGVSPNGR